ncbi:unnamed protein product [Rotaria socialis]|uniref:Uncharacterized protein n=1 Tax=Rotaria socialis TaxID=392032 RepID=A0A820VT27_9BILA|nr:unnamed protein product [Rotaria socialis]CAF4505348.1 unnamed protein product [Rotaria socialis]CAF4873421.1 unnamed protein product [Rotaria socialis]
MAMVNSMCVSYGRGKALIRQRQKFFKNKIVNYKIQVEQYEKQAPLSIDLKELERMINNFIKQDQYRLPIELEQQRHMLKFDAQDHRLVETFYQLNARKIEISSTKTIWKATHH